jgi:hypothetical protein
MSIEERMALREVIAAAFDRAATKAHTATHAASMIISELQLSGFEIVKERG